MRVDLQMATTSSPHNSAKVFDQSALRLRQARAKKRFLDKIDASPDFLITHAAKDIAERLALVSRQFSNTIDLFGRTGAMASVMHDAENITKVSRVELPGFHTENTSFEVFESASDLLDVGENPVDLLVSAFALHWSNDLPGTLIQLKNSIEPDGLFLGILAGPDTLNELRECLAIAESELFGGVTPRIDPFITVQAAGALMQRAGFALPVIDTETTTIRYDNMYDLINDLRAMAATNVLCAREKQKFSKKLFIRAAEIYANRFADEDGRIRATFELVFMSGWVPHQSQQNPSKPGSAAINLADAINQTKSD